MKKKQILFIEFYSSVMIYKLADQFRKNGYETVLIRIIAQNQVDRSFFDEPFDKVINFNIEHFKGSFFKILLMQRNRIKSVFSALIECLKLKPYVVIGKAMPNLPIALFRIFFRKYPFIYFPYDIRSQGDIEILKKNTSFLELKAERFLFENSDGIIHKGSPDELNPEYVNDRVLGPNIKLPKFKLSFPPYCSMDFIVPINNKKLSKKDKELHFVYVGGIPRLDKEYYIEYFKSFEKLVDNKYHVHFYFCNDTGDEDNQEIINSILKVVYNSYDHPNKKYFHVHPTFNPKDLIKEISKYDYGISQYNTNIFQGIELNFFTANKISTYLEAGIPMVYNKEYVYVDKILKEYGLEIAWPKNMDILKKTFDKLDYKKIQKNIEKARMDFLNELHFSELLGFVEDVTSQKRYR